MNVYNTKKGLGISNNIIAIDKRVIAKKGEKLEEGLLNRILEVQPQGIENEQNIEHTPLFPHFKSILDKEKYDFLSDCRGQLLEIVAFVKLNHLIFKELAWLTQHPYHYYHSLVVTLMVSRMALDLFGDLTKAREAASCALTHDFGITRVPKEILHKTSRLNEEEIKIVCEHPIYSYMLLTYYFGNAQQLNAVIAYEHHEDLRGTGYPRGIIQKNVISQLIKICDFYDALISARPFRPALSSEEALDMIAEEVNSGRLHSEAFALLKSYLRKRV